MLSKIRNYAIAAFLILGTFSSFTANAHNKKVDKAHGYKSYRLGTPRSEFLNILEKKMTDRSFQEYNVILAKAPELQQMFGDSVYSVSFRFDTRDKLNAIMIYYRSINTYGANISADSLKEIKHRVVNGIASEYEVATRKNVGPYYVQLYWEGKKVAINYSWMYANWKYTRYVHIGLE